MQVPDIYSLQGANYSPDSNIFRMNLTPALNHIIKILFSCTLNIFQPLSVLSSKDDLLLFIFFLHNVKFFSLKC